MAKTFITITGMNHYYGNDFLKPGMKVQLVKEPENEYDTEAIRVEFKSAGKIGYVANSFHTVQGKSLSAGRIYDRIGKKATAKVMLVIPQGVICKVLKKELKRG